MVTCGAGLTAPVQDKGREALEKLKAALQAVLVREQEGAKHAGLSDCRCINHSRRAEIEYETDRCPHQLARKLLSKLSEVR